MKTLIADYQPLWFSIAHKYTNNYHQSEELVQEALSRYLESGNKEVDNIKAYVAKTIYHLYISQIRKGKSAQAYTKHTSMVSKEAVESHNQYENQSEARQMLLKMYRILTPAERAVFVLRTAFDLEYEKLEKLFCLSNDNCRQLLRRAKTKMLDQGHRSFKADDKSASFEEAFFKASQQARVDELIDFLKKELQIKANLKKTSQLATVNIIAASSIAQVAGQRA